MKTEKDEKKGFFSFFKKQRSACCDMKIIEVEEKEGKKGCCDFKILPGEDGESKSSQ